MADDNVAIHLDEVKLWNIFSAEVWFSVLSKVRDAETYYKVCAATPPLKNILWQQRRTILFPSVAKILFNQWMLSLSQDKLQLLFKRRMICAEWRNIVDAFLQCIDHHRLFFKSETYGRSCIHSFHREGCERFETLSDIQNFMEHFYDTHCNPAVNPFMFKSVGLFVSLYEENQMLFLEMLVEMLTVYGRHVWYLHILVDVKYKMLLPFVTKLTQILELTPNLKAIKFLWRTVPDKVEDKYGIKDYFSTNHLPKLECLLIVKACGLQSAMTTLLHHNKSTVRELDLSHFEDFDRLIDLSNVNALSVLFKPWPPLAKFGWMEKHESARCLTKLSSVVMCNYTTAERAFKIMETKYSESLVELHLKLLIVDKLTPSHKLVLPKLRFLYLYVEGDSPLEFLVQMADTLETLFIQFYYLLIPDFGEPMKDIELLKFRGELHKSNIWKRFSKLQTLKCVWPLSLTNQVRQVDCCSRAEFRKHNQQ